MARVGDVGDGANNDWKKLAFWGENEVVVTLRLIAWANSGCICHTTGIVALSICGCTY